MQYALLWSVCYVVDAGLWVVAYELSSLALLYLVLTWSTALNGRYHLSLGYLYGVWALSAGLLFYWVFTGHIMAFTTAMYTKLAIFPCSGWLIEAHSQLPTIVSGVLLYCHMFTHQTYCMSFWIAILVISACDVALLVLLAFYHYYV